MRGRVRGTSCAALVLLAPGAAAQVAPNRASTYLAPTDVTDARALWVNPAGPGRYAQASVQLDLVVADPGPGGRLRQVSGGFTSRGLSFGYQRDRFDGGVRGHTYRVGFAAGHRAVALGLAAALYRGGTSSTGWDVGVLYEPIPALVLGGVIEHLGRPRVRDSALAVTYVPGATLRVLGGRAAISAHGRFTAHGTEGYAFGARAQLGRGGVLPIGPLVRLDTDGSLGRTRFAFGLSLGGQDMVGAVATTPGDVGQLDALSAYGVATRRLGGAPRR